MENKKIMFTMYKDKVPPNDQELERAVLGAILTENSAIQRIELSAEDFYNLKNRTIFQAIERLMQKHAPVDLLTVRDELKMMKAFDEAGGDQYLIELSESITSASHIEYHSAVLKQKTISRKLDILSMEVIQRVHDESQDVQDTIEYLEKKFTEIRAGSISEYLDMKAAIKKTTEYLAEIQQKREEGRSTTITTGLKGLDERLSGGWIAPDLIILGGRPSMGKSQLALHFAQAAAKNDHHCLFISIEMTVEQLIIRILTEDESLSYYNMKTGQMGSEEWLRIDEKISTFENEKLYIADNYNVRNLSNIKSLARKLKRNGELDLLIIDYLQLIKTNQSFGTRDLEIGYITGELKNLAKELSIPVILLAQLSRPVKGMKVQMPVLSDLRESGNIEQDADKVIFPHRPTYYDPDAVDKSGRSWKNRGILIIGKDREGVKDEKVFFRTDDRFKKIWDDNELPFTQQETKF